MPLKMKKTVQQMVDEANGRDRDRAGRRGDEAASASRASPSSTSAIRASCGATARIPGAINVTRGMLEMWIDPESPYAKDYFQSGNKFVFFCAGAWRSALATKTAQDMGLTPVAHLEGGLGAWKKAGGPVEKVEPKK